MSPLNFFIYLLLLFLTLMANHSDEDEEDDPAVEDLQSQFEDLDNEASALAGNRENDQPTRLGDLLTCPGTSARSSLTMTIQSLAGC